MNRLPRSRPVADQRVAILHTRGSGYLSAQLRALQPLVDDLFVSAQQASPGAPFDSAMWRGLPTPANPSDLFDCAGRLERFDPTILVVAGWSVPEYRRAMRWARKRGVLVVCGMDNIWIGSARQRLASASSNVYLHRMIDALWIPGAAQSEFARRLGFQGSRLMYGRYCCDTSLFGARPATAGDHSRFLYSGRLVPSKGIATLIDAYGKYRSGTSDPWPLAIAGTGELAGTLEGLDGVELMGFLQPPELAKAAAESGCLVLPSLHEPWGVVVHEAATAGLPIIASDRVGSTADLVTDRYNGRVVAAGDVGHLKSALAWMAARPSEQRQMYGERSRNFAAKFSPSIWADTLLEVASEIAEVGSETQ